MADNNRLSVFDIAKGIGIILVVLGHTGIPIAFRTWLYSFHVPLFFFVSGYFFNPQKYTARSFLLKRLKTLLLPYFYFLLIMVFWLKYLLHHNVDVIHQIFWRTDMAIWFIPVLFMAEMVVLLIAKFVHKRSIEFAILAPIIACSCFCFMFSVELPFHADVVGMALIYYLGGAIIKRNIPNFYEYSAIKFIIPLHILMCILLVPTTNMIYNYWGNAFINVILAYCGIASAFAISYFIDKIPSYNSPIKLLGENSMVVIGLSQPVYITINYLAEGLDIANGFVFRQFLLWVILYLFIIVIRKYTPWVIGK